jgi:hypothetical protein
MASSSLTNIFRTTSQKTKLLIFFAPKKLTFFCGENDETAKIVIFLYVQLFAADGKK